MKAIAALAVLALVALPACRRADRESIERAKSEISGAWVRDLGDGGPGVEGFDLRDDGSVGLLGITSMNGIAWNVSRDELVISTNTDRHAQPNPSRLRIASHDGDALELRADPPDFFAGRYRRSRVDHVSGVLTYTERIVLPSEALTEVRLTRGERLVARALLKPDAAVPIPFTLSVLPGPAGGEEGYALEASIAWLQDTLFATPAPIPVEAGATDVELLVRRTSAPR